MRLCGWDLSVRLLLQQDDVIKSCTPKQQWVCLVL